ncbi:ribosomal RNA-processing protein [Wolffia australiana]
MEEAAAWGEWENDVAVPSTKPNAGGNLQRHIKKRALKNKALSVGFNEKDLKDFVTGFHKRKKKRRKIAKKQIEEKDRKKRIEIRKQRKLERENAMYPGEAAEDDDEKIISGAEDEEDEIEQDEMAGTQSISGTKRYDSNDLTITVRTSELTREEDEVKPTEGLGQRCSSIGLVQGVSKKIVLQPKKKTFKRRAAGKKSSGRKKHGKIESKRKKGAKKGKKR